MAEKKVDFYGDYQKLIDSFAPFVKSEENPFFHSKYVKLPDILPEIKKNCKAHGFVLFQVPVFVEGKNLLQTTLLHVASEKEIVGSVELIHKPEDPQKLGGSITYMRRYSLTCMLGLEEIDDDGNFASGNTKKPSQNISQEIGIKKPKVDMLQMAKEKRLKCADCDELATVKRDGSAFYCKNAYMEDRPGVKHDNFIETVPFK